MKNMLNASKIWLVGIGASAGGVEALLLFFSHVQPGRRYVYVVAQHMASAAQDGHDQLLASLISKKTALPVHLVRDEAQMLAPDTIFLIAAGRDGILDKASIRAQAPRDVRLSVPSVDVLFAEIARNFGARAVGVVLSGVGSDGVLGCAEIKRHQGQTFAQDPAEARFGGMPLAAITARHIDYTLGVREIVHKLMQLPYTQLQPMLEVDGRVGWPLRSEAAQQGISVSELERILAQLDKFGSTDFSCYKPETLQRQLERRLKALNLAGAREYEAYLKNHPGEAVLLRDSFLISVSSFFRDHSSFAALETYLARFVAEKNDNQPIRAWSAGCGRGEEVYSVAYMLQGLTPRTSWSVLGTDLSQSAIEQARAGIYQKNSLPERPHQSGDYLCETATGLYSILPGLRTQVRFEMMDILRDTPAGPFDLILCRNVLIYFKENAQEMLFRSFHDVLNPKGLLFLGQSESLSFRAERLFSPLDFFHRIFTKRV